jgi:Skp family chaperone for outer membrane proteins
MKRVGGLISFTAVGVILIIGMVLFGNLSGANAASASVGFIDMETLQKELPDYQSLKQTFQDKESEFKLFQGYIYQEHQTAVKDLEKKYNQEKSGKSEDVQATLDKKLQSEIKKKAEELNKRLTEKRDEIQSYLQEQDQAVWEKVQKLVSEVAEDKKVSVVLDKKSVYHGGKDLTKDVIEKAKKQAEEALKNTKRENKESKPASK